ncbi:hypothetical protein I4U23_018645 [Adineta vaga]|nr:hypothetical protein I4U23_018645 [Adineta vaga]
MALKRKTRNLPNLNDADKRNQMSFFDPVYQNDDESDGELSMNSSSRQTFQDESNETLNANPTTQTENDETLDDDSLEISATRIFARIKQIQSSIQQAQTMLDSMERFKHLVPGSDDQCEKLRVIISNLEEQQAGYMNLFNLITLTNEERSELMNKMSSTDGLAPAYNNEQLNDDDDNDDDDEEEEEKNANKPPTQRKVQFPTCPRVESKTGLKPSTSLNQPQMNSSDNEQNTRNDNSNYDSLVGSLKSDTLNWKDQQSTSGDEGSDVENDKELERNLMLQKEQLRALQGQKRALLALKKRSEKRLFEQQEQLLNQKSNNKKEEPKDDNLLSDINHLRDRLQLLRNLYEQKHDVEVQQIKNSTKVQTKPAENRAQNLEHVRQQLNELEEIVNYYQLDLMDQPEEETTVYEEDQIQPDDVQRLKSLIIQQKQQTSSSQTNHNENTAKPLNKLSDELATKRLELEQAKFALNRLQQMVKTIEPDQPSSSVRSTPVPSSSNKQTKTNEQNLSSISTTKISPKSNEKTNSILTTNTYADAKMAAQHREIERLVESRQRLQSLKDQIASLHQSMTTPPIPLKTDLVDTTEVENQRPKSSYKNQANTSERRNTDDNNLQLYRFECESGDGEETDEDSDEEIQPRIKQGNFHAAEDIVAEHEQRLLSNKKSDQNDDLSAQMREICRCLSTFIQEQKSFNRHIEEHLTAATNNSSRASVPSVSNVGGSSGDALFNQLQQQVLTQGLIVNLNTAYREIAVLQSEINALQSENNRLTSSLSSYDSQYQHKARLNSRDNSKESLYSTERTRTVRPQVRPKLNEYVQPFDANLLTKYNQFENSSKTSFNSQSTGKRTAINFDKNQMEITPTKHERNGTFIADRLASPKPTYSNTKQISDEYEITSNQYRHSSKSVPSKSFIIRRRFITNDNEDSLIQSSSSNYDQRLQQNTFDDDDEDDDDDDDDEMMMIMKVMMKNKKIIFHELFSIHNLQVIFPHQLKNMIMLTFKRSIYK